MNTLLVSALCASAIGASALAAPPTNTIANRNGGAESVVQRQLDRYNARDLEGFLATYADDVAIFDLPALGKPSMAGKATMRKVYGDLFARNPGLNCRLANRIVEGRFVIDQEACTTGAGRPPMRAAAIYEVINGLIQRVWFADPQAPFDDNE